MENSLWLLNCQRMNCEKTIIRYMNVFVLAVDIQLGQVTTSNGQKVVVVLKDANMVEIYRRAVSDFIIYG